MPKKDTIVAFPEIVAVSTSARGKRTKGLEHVQKFLNRFGYMAEAEISEAGLLDGTTATMLKRYQRQHGLRETGQFDAATRDMMTTTRCAMRDMNNGVAFATTCSWNSCNLTFAFDVGTNDIGGAAEFQAVRNAFRHVGQRGELHVHGGGRESEPGRADRLAARQRSRPEHGGRLVLKAGLPPMRGPAPTS